MILCQIFDREDTFYLLNSTFKSGDERAKDHSSGIPLMYRYYQHEYLGATHGMVGILTILLWWVMCVSVCVCVCVCDVGVFT